jgi:hypothetical protein
MTSQAICNSEHNSQVWITVLKAMQQKKKRRKKNVNEKNYVLFTRNVGGSINTFEHPDHG